MRQKYPLGTTRVPRPKAFRLVSYIRGLGWAIAFFALAAAILALVQAAFHPFDLALEKADASLAVVDSALAGDQVAGISIGTLALVALVAAIPLFRRGVRRKQYAVSFWRGLLSSAIFLATDKLYRYVQSLGLLYFSATLAVFVAATIVLVEIISRMGRLEDEADTRTELLASIVSGLVFGLLVQVGGYLFSLLKHLPR
jgi:hypothetical protein